MALRSIFLLTLALTVAQDSRPVSKAPMLDTAIELARRDHPEIDEIAVRAEIEKLAKAYEMRAVKAVKPEEKCEALRLALFADGRLKAVVDLNSAETLHIDSVLKTRSGYCLSLSVVALAVAERVGLPLFGVAAPNHFFVRYDDGTYRRNLELTRSGEAVADAEFRERMGGAWNESSVFLKNLGLSEVRAELLHNRGFVAMQRGRKKEAAADFEAAIKLMPGLPEAHRNFGVLYGEAHRWAEAIESFTLAIQLYPNDADALLNRALCYRETKQMALALGDLESTLLVDRTRERANALAAEWKKELSQSQWPEWQKLVVKPLASPPPNVLPGFLGSYYSGKDFGKLISTRVDTEFDFDWRNSAPMRGVPSDRFSVRWDGWLTVPKAATYSLFVIANDGVRVLIDERPWIDHWQDSGWDNYYGSADVSLIEGWHRIRIEMYDERGGARLLFRLGVEGVEKPLRLKDVIFSKAPTSK